MVQFSLPQNSKIIKGKYFQDKSGSNNLKKLMFIDGTPQQMKIQELIPLKLI